MPVFVKVTGFCCADLVPEVCIYLSLVQTGDILFFHQLGSFRFSEVLVNCWKCASFNKCLPCAAILTLSSFGEQDTFKLRCNYCHT